MAFINLYKSKSEALSTMESPITQYFMNTGIQLLPNNVYPYIQTTSNTDGIELEDWTVYAKSVCKDTVLANLTDYFTVERIFDDSKGIPQIDWSLTNVPYDFGSQLIYLEITQTIGEVFYTNPFQISEFTSGQQNQGIGFTSRIDYKNADSDTMQSIQVQCWFRQWVNEDEVSSYYRISTKVNITNPLKIITSALYKTEWMSNELFKKLRDALYNKHLYINLVRCTLSEAFKIPDVLGDTNFAEADFKLNFNENDIYNPLYTPPVPPPVPNEIALNIKVKRTLNTYFVTVYFESASGYTTIILGSSYITINGSTGGFESEFVTVDGNNIQLLALNVKSGMPTEATISLVGIRVSNGLDLLDMEYSTPDIVFSASDITNQIVKTAVATVTPV